MVTKDSELLKPVKGKNLDGSPNKKFKGNKQGVETLSKELGWKEDG